MSAKSLVLALPLENSVKISKWKVKEGTIVSVGRVILLYDVKPGNGQPQVQKLKCTAVGTVRKLLAREGDVVKPGDPLLQLEKCTHPTVMKDMCAECGADLRNEESSVNESTASIPMVHSIPELKVNEEQAQILGKADEERLLATRKLVLLVDLDQTLIHTTNDNIPPNLKDVYHFKLHGSLSPWHHTRLRPGTKKFLKEMSEFYELHICTFGSRMYAHMIAMFLDPDGQYFSHRILSRDECFSANSKTANLKALFPCGDNMVCIIDDREDVWNFAPNLIHVKPYHFFQHTGDINAPPGLAKCENDDSREYDFSCLGDGKKPLNDVIKNESQSTSKVFTVPIQSSSEEGEIERKVKSSSVGSTSNSGKETESISISASEMSQGNVPQVTQHSNEDSTNQVKEAIIEDVLREAAVSEPRECEKRPVRTEFDQVSGEEENEVRKGSTPPSNSENLSEQGLKKEDDGAKPSEIPLSVVTLKEEICNVNQTKRGDAEKADMVVIQEENLSADLSNTDIPADSPCNDDPKKMSDEVNTLSLEKSKDNKKSTEPKSEEKQVDQKSTELKSEEKQEEIEVVDGDDYLLYLEEVLRSIHKEFYRRLDSGQKPDMKEVVPAVRKQVLSGASLVFSGLVPNNIPLERSRAYQVAISLGAHVTQDLNKRTTHLVAVRPGTAKVNSARRMKNLYMVTADWLWTCAERWERVDEKVFPLGRNRAGTRHPPAHCGSPEHTPIASEGLPEPSVSTGRNRTASGRFMDTINPLLSFSSADIADMDQEIDDILNESESDGEGAGTSKKRKIPVELEAETGSDGDSQPANTLSSLQIGNQTPVAQSKKNHDPDDTESSSSSADSLSGEHPRGWGKHDLKRKHVGSAPGAGTASESDGDDEADDMPSAKFRRGEALPSDLDMGENESESNGSEEPPDEIDDGDWNMMGAALEREFLS